MWVEKRGKTWRIRDRRGGRLTTLATSYPNKTTAKAALVQLQADELRGDALIPRGGQVTLADWVDAWWPAYRASLKPSTAYSEGARIRNHITPHLGHLSLDEVTPVTVQRWVSALAARLSPKSIRNVHGVLHKLMASAVSARMIRTNPCADTPLPRRHHREMRFLTEPEASRLLSAVPEHWRPLVTLLLATGLRWGEAVALRIQDVDVLAGRLVVTRTLHEMPGTGDIVITEPKSARSRRTVMFPPAVAEVLVPLVAGRARDALVFTSPEGQPVRTRNFRRGWVKWTVAAGLDQPRERGQRRVEGLRIHDLRHTHAAWLISAGHPLTAIQRRLGHSSIAVTSDLYGHLLPVVDQGIMDTVSAALRGSSGGATGAPTVPDGAATGRIVPAQSDWQPPDQGR